LAGDLGFLSFGFYWSALRKGAAPAYIDVPACEQPRYDEKPWGGRIRSYRLKISLTEKTGQAWSQLRICQLYRLYITAT
jgi:hypothetical protein